MNLQNLILPLAWLAVLAIVYYSPRRAKRHARSYRQWRARRRVRKRGTWDPQVAFARRLARGRQRARQLENDPPRLTTE